MNGRVTRIRRALAGSARALEGPIVGKLQAAFQEHWFKEVGETLSGKGQFPELAPAGNLRAQVVASESFSAAPLLLVQAVAFPRRESPIYITNAYCAPSGSQTRALVAAVKRGVDVRLLLPGKHNDQPATKAAGRTAYGELLKGGVKIYEFQPTMIHSKTMVIDGIFSILGSSNFDARSAQINEELDITVYDEVFGRRDAGCIRERSSALKAVYAGGLQPALPLGAIHGMGDASVSLANMTRCRGGTRRRDPPDAGLGSNPQRAAHRSNRKRRASAFGRCRSASRIISAAITL